MKLKGLEDFEKWYQSNDFGSETQPMAYWFYRLPESMQWGVYVDFFNTHDIKISMQWLDSEYCYEVAIPSKNMDLGSIIADWWIVKEEYEKDLPKCREIAIGKANEIYNEQRQLTQ